MSIMKLHYFGGFLVLLVLCLPLIVALAHNSDETIDEKDIFKCENVNYRIERKLGGGAYGVVSLVKKDNDLYVLKTTDKKSYEAELWAYELLKNSPYVAPIVQPCQSQNAFVTEYSKSESLYDRLKLIQSNTALMDRDEQIRLLSKAILAFEDMYRAKIVHNDIKDRNVLWDGKDFNLIDFGLAESWDNGKWNDVAMHYPCNEYGGNKDWIALGVMMYQVHAWNSIDAKKRSQLAIKRAYLLPYTVNFEIRKHENLCSNGQLDEIQKPSYMDQDFFDVLKLLLQKKQSLRPGYNDESIEKLKRMPLFKNYLY